tara:strand:- start:20 stop:220 length:201 start_codon:yes stop_codon:yes gene_type:complete
MPKSRTRKNHKKKVAARNMKLKNEAKKMQEAMDSLQKAYVDEMSKKSKESATEDSGDVPFTLGDNT